MHHGIDIYSGQGQPDFHAVRRDNNRFVYIKATEGFTYTDHGFRLRFNNAISSGLHAGFYHFLRPTPGRSGAREAEHFYEAVRYARAGTRRGNSLLRLAVDIEVTNFAHEADTLAYARECVERLQHLCEHQVVIYTFPAFMSRWTGLTQHPLWIANYEVSRPTLPHGFAKWDIWQYSSTARVDGVQGNCDVNKCPRITPLLLERRCY